MDTFEVIHIKNKIKFPDDLDERWRNAATEAVIQRLDSGYPADRFTFAYYTKMGDGTYFTVNMSKVRKQLNRYRRKAEKAERRVL